MSNKPTELKENKVQSQKGGIYKVKVKSMHLYTSLSALA